MTKLRAPLTQHAALDRVAGQLRGGYAELAQHLDKAEGHVRAWGDPDRREEIPFGCAVRADLIYRAAGGDGAPFFETFAYQLDHAGIDRFFDEIALGRLVGESIRESGEAHAAAIALAQPGADQSQRPAVRREVLEAIDRLNRLLPFIDRADDAAHAALSVQAPDKHGHEATAPPVPT